MLQARLLSYPDAHRYRIGVNYGQLAVNKPRCPVQSYHKDGQLRFDGNGGDQPVYQPNSFGGPEDGGVPQEPPLRIDGDAARYDHREGNDDYGQAGDLYRLMTPEQRRELVANIVGAMKEVPESIQRRQFGHFMKADPEYGHKVAEGLGLAVDEAEV
jgi:catalase